MDCRILCGTCLSKILILRHVFKESGTVSEESKESNTRIHVTGIRIGSAIFFLDTGVPVI